MCVDQICGGAKWGTPKRRQNPRRYPVEEGKRRFRIWETQKGQCHRQREPRERERERERGGWVEF